MLSVLALQWRPFLGVIRTNYFNDKGTVGTFDPLLYDEVKIVLLKPLDNYIC